MFTQLTAKKFNNKFAFFAFMSSSLDSCRKMANNLMFAAWYTVDPVLAVSSGLK